MFLVDWITGKSEKEALQKMVDSNPSFAFKFYQSLCQVRRGDLLYSPSNIQVILGILYVGAIDKGLTQIEEALQMPPERKTIVNSARALLNYMKNLKYARMDTPIRVCTPGHIRIGKDFYITCGQDFDVRVKPTNFRSDTGPERDSINEWVRKSTHNRVNHIIRRQRMDDSTQLLVVNGVSFEARMAVPFLAMDTTNDLFYCLRDEQRTVKFMNQIGMLRYTEIEHLRAHVLELPYKCPYLSLMLLLPFDTYGLSAIEEKIHTLNLMELLQQMPVQRVKVTIPSFRLLECIDASDQLYDIGLDSLMETHNVALRNVTHSSPGLPLTHLQHKLFFELAEEATDPVSAGIVRLPEDSRIPTKIFRANHPFTFIVMDNTSGLILIMGRLTCIDRFDMNQLRLFNEKDPVPEGIMEPLRGFPSDQSLASTSEDSPPPAS